MSEGHRFYLNGKCIWCGASREKVADRKAPPYCPDRPEELNQDRRDEGRAPFTGY